MLAGKIIGEDEFRKTAIESFYKEVPDEFRERADEFLKSEEGEDYLSSGYRSYVWAVNDEERCRELYQNRTREQVMRSWANATAWNLFMSY